METELKCQHIHHVVQDTRKLYLMKLMWRGRMAKSSTYQISQNITVCVNEENGQRNSSHILLIEEFFFFRKGSQEEQ